VGRRPTACEPPTPADIDAARSVAGSLLGLTLCSLINMHPEPDAGCLASQQDSPSGSIHSGPRRSVRFRRAEAASMSRETPRRRAPGLLEPVHLGPISHESCQFASLRRHPGAHSVPVGCRGLASPEPNGTTLAVGGSSISQCPSTPRVGCRLVSRDCQSLTLDYVVAGAGLRVGIRPQRLRVKVLFSLARPHLSVL
jgi:hypothetical protein